MRAIRGNPMKLLIKLATLLCGIISLMLMAHHSASASEFVGVRQIVAPSKERGSDLAVTVWYPADAGGTPVTLGESAFFVGTDAMLEAPISRGRYPLILLSHGAGLGGTPQAMSWIATPLAKQGFIVVAPTHPGNAGANRSAAETMKLWLRPADITATLDAIEKDAPFRRSASKPTRSAHSGFRQAETLFWRLSALVSTQSVWRATVTPTPSIPRFAGG